MGDQSRIVVSAGSCWRQHCRALGVVVRVGGASIRKCPMLGVVGGGRGGLVGGGGLGVDSGALVGHIGDIAVIAVGGVLDVLDAAVGESHGVGAGNVGGTVGLLLGVEGGLGVVVSDGVGEGVGGDLVSILLGVAPKALAWDRVLTSPWAVDGLVAPLAPDHAVVGESVVDEVLGGGGSQGQEGQARESLDR